ncbi:hypothetical protein [Laspinema olomoucense]|uniref:hypothetical protein n=1 Tax=Laspinema olomoucense TaxID=3231600 RepID=UPI0021BB0DA3|nr:hypothetical protein [Laspinema sp. D3d]MCT7971726.1 hypothetical protein [Laspinema sp. D3d]
MRIEPLKAIALFLFSTTLLHPTPLLANSLEDTATLSPLLERNLDLKADEITPKIITTRPTLPMIPLADNSVSETPAIANPFNRSLWAETPQLIAQDPPLTEPPSPQTTESPTEIEELRQEWRLPLPPTTFVPIEPPTATIRRGGGTRVAPGSSSISPTAFGPGLGQFFWGAGFQNRTRFTDSADGTISTGFGLGNPRRTVGLQTTVTVLDLMSNRNDDDGFMKRGSISFKLHRLLPNNFAVAVGVENAIVWGFTDAGTSTYGVVSKTFSLRENTEEPFSRVTVSLGVGNGRFRFEDDFNNDVNTVNVFGSVGVRVHPQVSAIADWSGQDLTLAASIVPFKNIPLVFTPAIADITGSAGDGARFRLGVGYSHFFSF